MQTSGRRHHNGFNRRSILGLGAGGLAALTGGCSSASSITGSLFSVASEASIPVATGSIGSPLRVALLLPFSRDPQTAQVANDLKQAAEMALVERERSGITLVPKETYGTPEGAAAAAREAIVEGAELIIGPLYAAEVTVVKAIARAANVPVIAFSTDRTAAGDGAWLLSFLAGAEVERIIAFATGKGTRRYAALVPASAYGDAIAGALQASVANHGGALATIERFPADAAGMVGPVLQLKARLKDAATARLPVEGLLLAGGQETLPTLAPMLAYHGIDLKKLRLLGTGAWNVPIIGQQPALAGGWFAAPDPAGWQAFAGRYQQAYGHMPIRIAGLAYDAVNLAIALSAGVPGQRFSAEALTRSSGFAGVDGLFRLNADGTSERGLAVLEVQPLGPRVIEAAPTAFGPIGF